jgi:hypothetical protein
MAWKKLLVKYNCEKCGGAMVRAVSLTVNIIQYDEYDQDECVILECPSLHTTTLYTAEIEHVPEEALTSIRLGL